MKILVRTGNPRRLRGGSFYEPSELATFSLTRHSHSWFEDFGFRLLKLVPVEQNRANQVAGVGACQTGGFRRKVMPEGRGALLWASGFRLLRRNK